MSFLVESDDFIKMRERLMTPEELTTFRALPELVTIYRGCYEDLNEDGFCWSLDADIARRFPFLSRYTQTGTPVLITAEVPHDYIRFLKLCRGEFEVVVPYGAREVLDVEHIDPPTP